MQRPAVRVVHGSDHVWILLHHRVCHHWIQQGELTSQKGIAVLDMINDDDNDYNDTLYMLGG